MTRPKELAKKPDILEELVEKKFHKLINNGLKKELEENIRSLANRVIQEELHRETVNQNSDITNDKKREVRNGRERIFTPRNSTLTDLLEISHIRTVYHIFIVILILLVLNSITYDLVDSGNINLGVGLILVGFGKIEIVIGIWTCMQLASYLPYFGLKFYANCRHGIIKLKSRLASKLLNFTSLCAMMIYYVSLMVIPIHQVMENNLPIASSCVILLEMIRFMMKTYAFIRSVTPNILNSDSFGKTHFPSISWYTYFLFVPTLIYRNSYPRTNHINWNKVILQSIEVIAVVFYISFLCERFLIPYWANFGKPTEILEAKQLVLFLFASTLPGILTFLCGFYLLLHAWHNVFAEILTFADRQFYTDWWNQSDFGSYFRTWNMIVHDWLHTYIYKDIVILSGSRLLGKLVVFLTSAIFHELVVAVAFGFFYPVMLVMFGGFGFLLVFLTKHVNPTFGNIYLWLSFIAGNGIMWSLYGIEYFARINCPVTVDDVMMDFVTPRSWSCHRIVFAPN